MPSILDKISAKAGEFSASMLLLIEVRRLRHTLERGIDSQREIAGLDPIFTPTLKAVIESAEAIGPERDDDPDWLRIDLLEQLAHEANIPVDETTDLLALGRERGWLDEDGKIVCLPAGMQRTY